MLFPGVESESLVIALDLQGIACSAGAACSSGATDPSHVLAAIGLCEADARGCVRLSLGSNNTDEDIAQALEIIPAVVAAHRGVPVPTP
jgi:cysteine desulfurase